MKKHNTVKERINNFLNDRIGQMEKELADLNNMKERLNNNTFTEAEFNSLIGILKFWLAKRDEKK